jgi:hypothetical protein
MSTTEADTTDMTAVAVRAPESWTVVGVHPLSAGWVNVYKNRTAH